MKKHLLAAAVAAAVVSPAMAQNLTVYGLVDGGYGTSKHTQGSASTSQTVVGGINSGNGSGTLSGSRLGFKASEDLGAGNKIDVVLETGIYFTTGVDQKTAASATAAASTNGTLFGNTRAGNLTYTSNLGQIRLGLQNSLFKDITESNDPGAGASVTGAGSIYQAGAVTTRPGNAIYFFAPVPAGYTLAAGVMKSENPSNGTDKSNADGQTVAGSVSMAGFTVRAAWENYSTVYKSFDFAVVDTVYDLNASGTSAGTYNDVTSQAIGVEYALGSTTNLYVLNTNTQYDHATKANTVEYKNNLFGLKHKMGVNTIMASLSRGYILRGAITSDIKQKGYQLIGTRELSKRTDVYATIGQTKWEVSTDATTDVKRTDTFVGIRHKF